MQKLKMEFQNFGPSKYLPVMYNRRHFLKSIGVISIASMFSEIGAGTPETSERPNILWLTSEDNSIDWVGCYGNPLAQTPNIDKLATEGFQYIHAYANIAVCSPTRGSWITGIHAISMGIQPMRSRNNIPHEKIKYYPDLLKEAGYYAGNCKKTDFNIGGRSDKDCWDNPRQVDWNALKKNQPFFQVINTTSSHESKAHGSVENTEFDPDKVILPKYHPDIPDIRKNYAKYYDAIKKMDADIGASLKKLKKLGLSDNTIVIYNSDHGGVMPRSKRFLFDNSIHCPLIIRIPIAFKQLWPAEKVGMKVGRMVSFIDMPKTWLSLARAEIPAYMQGKIFLGTNTEPENEFHYTYSDRQGDSLDKVRGVRSKRYYYVKNYMPYVAWGQHASYTWKMKATQAWEAHHKAGKTDKVTGRFFLPKPLVEELYDTQTDPDNIYNLINDSKYTKIARRMRESLHSWQLEVFDSGLLPEDEMVKRAADNKVTIYDMVRDQKLYDLKAYMEASDLAMEQDPKNISQFVKFFKSPDSGLRYWAVVGCLMLRKKAVPVQNDIIKLLKDESHEVRAMSAWHLIRYGDKQSGLACLEDLLRNNTYAMMKTLSIIMWIGEDGRVLIPAVKQAETKTKYVEQKKMAVLGKK